MSGSLRGVGYMCAQSNCEHQILVEGTTASHHRGNAVLHSGDAVFCSHSSAPSPQTTASDYTFYEDGAQADGWSNAEVTSDPGREVHGPWGNDARDVSRSVTVPAGVSSCTVSWRSYARGSRDNEADTLELNGVEVWRENRHHPGSWISEDHEVTVACSGSLSIRFRSGIDEGEGNEAWAFSDVRVASESAAPMASEQERGERTRRACVYTAADPFAAHSTTDGYGSDAVGLSARTRGTRARVRNRSACGCHCMP